MNIYSIRFQNEERYAPYQRAMDTRMREETGYILAKDFTDAFEQAKTHGEVLNVDFLAEVLEPLKAPSEKGEE